MSTDPNKKDTKEDPKAKSAQRAQAQAEKQKRKEENKAKRGGGAPKVEEGATNYGTLPIIQSQSRTNRVYTPIGSVDENLIGKSILIRGRIHNSRDSGKLGFVVLRQRYSSVQIVLDLKNNSKITKPMIKFVTSVSKESIVDVEGIVSKAEKPVESTSQKNVEIQLHQFFVVSAVTVQKLPLLVSDAEIPQPILDAQTAASEALTAQLDEKKKELAQFKESNEQDEEKTKKLHSEIEELTKQLEAAPKHVIVNQKTILDNRIIDLRTTTNQAIFTLQSAVCQLFREFLLQQNFVEIHTPKIISAASEGGADVFKVSYFSGTAYLAQSPQLYKQMAVCGDLERVFEIAPVFRAENANTHRHLTEFIGLDLEMAFNEHYHEVLDVLDQLFVFIFDNLKLRFSRELEVVRKQYPFEDLQYHRPSLRLQFKDAIALLREHGETIGDLDDINTTQEKKLGRLIKEKYKTDFYMLDKFPTSVRPFYTMEDPHDPNYTNSYDFFLRGEEILSGAQRIHDPIILENKAKSKGVRIESIQAYIDAFKYGAPPHGGGGIGLERVVMLYLGLPNIRRTSMFPRDPARLTP